MRTSTTTKNKTAVYAKRIETPVRARSNKKYEDMPANCRSVEEFEEEFFKRLKKRYGRI